MSKKKQIFRIPTFTDPGMESSEACEGEANDESNAKGGEGRGEERDDQADGGVSPDALAPPLLVHHQALHPALHRLQHAEEALH